MTPARRPNIDVYALVLVATTAIWAIAIVILSGRVIPWVILPVASLVLCSMAASGLLPEMRLKRSRRTARINAVFAVMALVFATLLIVRMDTHALVGAVVLMLACAGHFVVARGTTQGRPRKR